MKRKVTNIPVFKSESEEADWWACCAGRRFVKQKSNEAGSAGRVLKGSPMVDKLKRTTSA